MATASKYLKGQDVAVYLEGTKIAESTSCTISYSMDTEDVSSKDDSDYYFQNNSPTMLGWTIQNDSFFTSTDDFKTLGTAWLGRGKIEVQAKDANEVVNLHGYAFITSLSVDAPVDGYAKVSMTLEGTGSDLIDED
ncbi:MAG: phage tail protein [Prevotellaceae bacterium]|nr:phage tail protein [Prevotellaceae bacterium]